MYYATFYFPKEGGFRVALEQKKLFNSDKSVMNIYKRHPEKLSKNHPKPINYRAFSSKQAALFVLTHYKAWGFSGTECYDTDGTRWVGHDPIHNLVSLERIKKLEAEYKKLRKWADENPDAAELPDWTS